MNRAMALFVILALVVAAGHSDLQAKELSQSKVDYMRKAFCEKEAVAKRFGVHWIKRHRYIQKCLAETRK
jgi:hypothetical protein